MSRTHPKTLPTHHHTPDKGFEDGFDGGLEGSITRRETARRPLHHPASGGLFLAQPRPCTTPHTPAQQEADRTHPSRTRRLRTWWRAQRGRTPARRPKSTSGRRNRARVRAGSRRRSHQGDLADSASATPSSTRDRGSRSARPATRLQTPAPKSLTAQQRPFPPRAHDVEAHNVRREPGTQPIAAHNQAGHPPGKTRPNRFVAFWWKCDKSPSTRTGRANRLRAIGI